MLALLSILFALGLLGLTVFALHRYQTMAVEFNVDRSVPLPPLESSADPAIPENENTRPESRVAPKPAVVAKTNTQKPKTASVSPKSWQDTVAKLKNAGNFTEAAQLCEQQLPLWGAYSQLCMLTRSEMKASSLESEAMERYTARLFKTAAIAEFLHDKSADSVKLTNGQLRKLDLDAINNLDFPYAEIGYAHLRLIRKSDIKYMVELWGRPGNHCTPREFHSVWWHQNVKS